MSVINIEKWDRVMLTSTITSTSAVSSAAGAVSMTTGTGVPEYGVLAVITLIALLSTVPAISQMLVPVLSAGYI